MVKLCSIFIEHYSRDLESFDGLLLCPDSHFLSFQEGIGSLKVVPGGIELRGQAAVLDALVASSLKSRRGKNLVLESWSNFTASARSHDGRLLARLTVGKLY